MNHFSAVAVHFLWKVLKRTAYGVSIITSMGNRALRPDMDEGSLSFRILDDAAVVEHDIRKLFHGGLELVRIYGLRRNYEELFSVS